MRFTRARDLVAAGLVALFAVLLLVRLFYADLPTLPTAAGTSLALLAVGEAALAVLVALAGPAASNRPLVPALAVARIVQLAKASSLLGAIMLGAWLAVLGHVLPRRADFPAAAADTTTAIIGAICALALIAAALWLEHGCRTPDSDDLINGDEPGADGR